MCWARLDYSGKCAFVKDHRIRESNHDKYQSGSIRYIEHDDVLAGPDRYGLILMSVLQCTGLLLPPCRGKAGMGVVRLNPRRR
jgi:hypothetical protein